MLRSRYFIRVLVIIWGLLVGVGPVQAQKREVVLGESATRSMRI